MPRICDRDLQMRPVHRFPIEYPAQNINGWRDKLHARRTYPKPIDHHHQAPQQSPFNHRQAHERRYSDKDASTIRGELRQLKAMDVELDTSRQILENKQHAIEKAQRSYEAQTESILGEVGRLAQQQADLSNVVTENIEALKVSLGNILEIAEQSSKVTLENMEMLYVLTGRANLQDAPPQLPKQTPSIAISTQKLKDFANLHKQNEMQLQAAINALVQAHS